MTQQIAAAALATLPPVALVDRKAFADAMARAIKTVERRSTIPILANVRLQGNGESLLIEATDLDVYSSFTIPGAVDSRFAVTVPAHMLRDILKKASSEYVEAMPWLGNGADFGAVQFDFEGAKASLQSLPVSDFPALVPAPAACSFTMETATLRRMLEAVTAAISTEETRYYLNGVYFHLANGPAKDSPKLFRAVATDGHRLLSATLAEIPAGAENMPAVIVPRKTCALLLAELKRKGAPGSVEIQASATQVCFTIGAAVIRSKIVDGTFPDYARIIPDSNDKCATVNAKAFAAMVTQVSQISSERGRAVKFAFGPFEIAAGRQLGDTRGTIAASVDNPESGSASQSMPCDYTGDVITIGFNGRYILELVDALFADSLVIKLGDPGSPARIEAVTPGAYGVTTLAVLMPMRI